MNRPWMPLYISEYLADTGHLSAAEHGAYLLLIMHYWQKDGLPSDGRQLARICRMTPAEWAESRETLAAFFEEGWKHGRIDDEIAHAEDIISKRKGAALEMHRRRLANEAAKARAEAEQKQTHLHLHLQEEVEKEEERKKDAADEESAASEDLPSPSATVVPIRPKRPEPTDVRFFRRFREVCGSNSGGLAKKYLMCFDGDPQSSQHGEALVALERAAKMGVPRDFIAKHIRDWEREQRDRASGDTF